ncbi:hypothetical protein RCL1_002859 [Eukaryota sp. TZLM3-RCL]
MTFPKVSVVDDSFEDDELVAEEHINTTPFASNTNVLSPLPSSTRSSSPNEISTMPHWHDSLSIQPFSITDLEHSIYCKKPPSESSIRLWKGINHFDKNTKPFLDIAKHFPSSFRVSSYHHSLKFPPNFSTLIVPPLSENGLSRVFPDPIFLKQNPEYSPLVFKIKLNKVIDLPKIPIKFQIIRAYCQIALVSKSNPSIRKSNIFQSTAQIDRSESWIFDHNDETGFTVCVPGKDDDVAVLIEFTIDCKRSRTTENLIDDSNLILSPGFVVVDLPSNNDRSSNSMVFNQFLNQKSIEVSLGSLNFNFSCKKPPILLLKIINPKKNTLDWSLGVYSPIVATRAVFQFVSDLMKMIAFKYNQSKHVSNQIFDPFKPSYFFPLSSIVSRCLDHSDLCHVMVSKFYQFLSSKFKNSEDLEVQSTLAIKLGLVLLPLLGLTFVDQKVADYYLSNHDTPERLTHDFTTDDYFIRPLDIHGLYT